MSALKDHLINNTVKQNETDVNESIVLSTIVCTACIGYAFKGLLETDFMKSVGEGIGGLLSGFGSLFAGVKGSSNIPKEDLKEMHTLLKKKDADLTPRERARINELSGKYNWENDLSEKELDRMNEYSESGDDEDDDTTNDDTTNDDTTNGESTETTTFTRPMLDGLILTAKNANNAEKDESKKAENDELLNLLVAASYDKDGNPVDIDKIHERVKDTVGEDNWDDFKGKIDTIYNEHKDSKEFKDAVKKVQKEVKPEDAEKFLEETKEHAKTAIAKIEKAKEDGLVMLKGTKEESSYTSKEIEDLQDELADLDPDKEEDKEKIAEKEAILKKYAKDHGKDEDSLIPKIETKDGQKPIQKKTGPRGAKYYRRKDDNGWSGWVWYKSPSDIPNESKLYTSLKNYLLEIVNLQ